MSKQTYENEPGLARRFWNIADRISGQGKKRKAGSGVTVAGVVTAGVGVLVGDTAGLITMLAGGAAVTTGLVLRFFPEKGIREAMVADVQKMDVDKLTDKQKEQLATECGVSPHELDNKLDLLAASANEIAHNINDKFGERFKAINNTVKQSGEQNLSRRDREVWDMMKYLSAFCIKENVVQLEAVAS